MTVEQVKVAKKALEEKIMDILKEFEARTELKVGDLGLSRSKPAEGQRREDMPISAVRIIMVMK